MSSALVYKSHTMISLFFILFRKVFVCHQSKLKKKSVKDNVEGKLKNTDYLAKIGITIKLTTTYICKKKCIRKNIN